MIELITVIIVVTLYLFLSNRWSHSRTASGEEESTSEKLDPKGIVGKSTFVLTAGKRAIPETSSSGKMDVEVPLEYHPDIDFIEEQEELEQLGLPTELSSDITFEDMMEVVNEVESAKPQNPTKAGKLLHENENTDWVQQMASTSSDYQKRIVELIDVHLEKLGQTEMNQEPSNNLEGFDIGEYVK